MPDLPVTGMECKTYYNTGTNASPTWVLIGDAQDVRITDLSWGEAELLSRSSDWAFYKPTIVRAAIEIDYVFGGNTTVWQALRDVWVNKTQRQFAIMDGTISTTGQQGLKVYCNIFSMPVEQPLEEWVTVTFGLKPCRFVESSAVVAPSWFTAS